MRTSLLVVALAASLPLAAVASGGQDQPPPQSQQPSRSESKTGANQTPPFDVLDTNKDGRISMAEASADPTLMENFSVADRNGDGYLDNTEYQSAIRQPRKQ